MAAQCARNNYCRIWVSEVIEWPFSTIRTKGAFLSSLVKFGLIPNFFYGLFVYQKSAFFQSNIFLLLCLELYG